MNKVRREKYIHSSFARQLQMTLNLPFQQLTYAPPPKYCPLVVVQNNSANGTVLQNSIYCTGTRPMFPDICNRGGVGRCAVRMGVLACYSRRAQHVCTAFLQVCVDRNWIAAGSWGYMIYTATQYPPVALALHKAPGIVHRENWC